MEYREFNQFQSSLAELELSKEVYTDIISAVDEIEFINRLTTSNIKRVADLEKDENGKVIVDLTNPHILENMNYFRESAIHYQAHGCYTLLSPNSHPLSPYTKFWNQEADRIINGMTRPDGEWIPGGLYFYWNYCPISLTKRKEKGRKRSDRVKDFPFVFLGDYLFYHYMEQALEAGEHIELLKSRGVGFSYKQASFGPRKALFFKNSSTFYTAFEKEYLIKDGVLNKAWEYLDFLAQNTPFPRMRLKDSLMEKKLGYKDTKTNAEKGMLSEIVGVSAKDDPDKLRGKRGDIFFEEHGVFPQIKKAWMVSLNSVEDGENVYALLCAGGTGGTIGADFEGAEDMHYNPGTYHIHGIPNVYDRFATGKTNTGFFWGAYLNRANCYDENGMPDVIKALVEIFKDREIIRAASTDPQHITQRCAEMPITPQEAVMRTEGNFFPVADLKDYLEKCRLQGKSFFSQHYIGKLRFEGNNLRWEEEPDSFPIIDYPLKDNKVTGAVELYKHPQKVNGVVIANRYIAGIDPVDDDSSTTDSLASIFIFDLFTDEIAAEYTGRPKFANDFYDICRRLLLYYNARANYENDKKGIFAYFELNKCLHLLVDTPQILRDMEYVKNSGYGNKGKGTNSGKVINAWGRRLQRDWVLTPSIIKNSDENGVSIDSTLNMHRIRSLAYLEEMIKWNIDANADRVSAMGMCMILRADKLKYLESYKSADLATGSNEADDPYFKSFDDKRKNQFGTPLNSRYSDREPTTNLDYHN